SRPWSAPPSAGASSPPPPPPPRPTTPPGCRSTPSAASSSAPRSRPAPTAARQADNTPWMQEHPWGVILLGVAVAGAVHATKATARPLVNATTVGTGTPVVSAAAAAASLGMLLISVLLP